MKSFIDRMDTVDVTLVVLFGLIPLILAVAFLVCCAGWSLVEWAR